MNSGDHGGGASRPYDDKTKEQELIKKAQRELPYNSTAYTELVSQYEQMIYWVCRRILGNDHDAQDAKQEVLIRVFHHLKKFRGQSTFKTWLTSISRNVSLTIIKKNKRHTDHRSLNDDLHSFVEPSYDPRGDNEMNMDLDRLLQRLNVTDREVVTLRLVAQLELKEIAAVMGANLSSTKMRLYRATEKMEKMLENGDS